jgi:hypothetical protein
MVWNAYKPDQLRALTSRVASLVISICSPSRQLLLAIVFLSLLYTSGIHATTPRQCAILSTTSNRLWAYSDAILLRTDVENTPAKISIAELFALLYLMYAEV